MNAEQFIKWLRDALAHGDGRTIRPLHKLSNNGDKTLLAGFRIVFPATRGLKRNLILSLYHDDMRRLGSVLAEEFCNALKSSATHYCNDQAFEAAAARNAGQLTFEYEEKIDLPRSPSKEISVMAPLAK
jgi:hypothetical protein